MAKRIQSLSSPFKMAIFSLGISCCPFLWAAQEAIVTTEKAVIYADQSMTSPVGFIARGKRVRVGEIPRNKSQIYPIIVSGKVAYIRISDISTELESVNSNVLVAERFSRVSKKPNKTQYGISGFNYQSQVSLDKAPGELKNNDPFVWNGFQIKGTRQTFDRWDLGVIAGYAEGKEGIETFRMFELGADISFRIYSGSNFIFRWQNQLQAVPFTTYALGNQARVNGYGFSAGSGLNANWTLSNNWGIDVYGGVQYTSLFGFELPNPKTSAANREEIALNPSFLGTRIGAGLTYRY